MLTERARATGCLTDFEIDRWLAEEVENEEKERLLAHAATCLRCEERRRMFARERDDLAARLPFPLPPPRKEEERAANRKPWPPLLAQLKKRSVALSAFAAAALLFVMLRPAEPYPTTRSKGAPTLSFFIKRGNAVERGEDGAHVAQGDALRFTTSSSTKSYLTILSRDAANTLNVYAPAGDLMQEVDPGSDRPLESSVVLDAALGKEEVFGVFCERQLAIAPLLEALRTSAAFPPAGCQVQKLTLYKESIP